MYIIKETKQTEDVISSSISKTTDAPPETRIKKPEDETKIINLTKDR